MNFSKSDLQWHWRDYDKVIPANDKILSILNSLTDEQKNAVHEYGQARYSEGSHDGYGEGQNESY